MKDNMDELDKYQERGTYVNDPDEDQCWSCKANLSDRAVRSMTFYQLDVLEAGICPFCGIRII